MGLKQELESNVDAAIKTVWGRREGREREVPEYDDRVKFIRDAVELDATFVYADLRDSTSLATAVDL